jgi:hypothetical protein
MHTDSSISTQAKSSALCSSTELQDRPSTTTFTVDGAALPPALSYFAERSGANLYH